ncbi:MAG: DegT/DnrJ/EryC1/StrS family aminotransferase [Actinomycetota bacterium]|nr:DegT/DnrJ/EryC1/StrS family aminotransferase [Actinomycetota bacterium]
MVLCGFNPVFVDVDRETFNITAENVEDHLKSATDVSQYSFILPVHLMTYPCDMDRINDVAKKYNLPVFEDSAQAHGTIYKGRKTGALSLLSAFSFYIAHNIQAGEMGAITTNDIEIAKLIRRIKAHGRVCDCLVCLRSQGKCPKAYRGGEELDPRFTHDLIGCNFKTMEFQAALGIAQLKKVEWITKKRRENVKYLNENLQRYAQILQLPRYFDNVSYLAYPIVIKDSKIISRKKLCRELEKNGVETRPLFGCIPTQQPAYNYLKQEYKGKLSNAGYIGKSGFYVGCHQYLKREHLDHIVEAFNKILK